MEQRPILIGILMSASGAHVADVEIPRFETGYPPAILWGARFFLRMGSSDSGRYIETFCYAPSVEVRPAEKPHPYDPRLNGNRAPGEDSDDER